METFVELWPRLLEALGPLVVGLLTVPLVALVKRYAAWLDAAPAWSQRVVVFAVAGALTALGSVAQVALPADLALFTDVEVAALLSAAIAYGVHAGDKARTAKGGS